MAELIGLVIGIAAFTVQIGGTIESIRALREFTPAEFAGQLQRLSDRLDLFRTNLLLLKPFEGHPTLKAAVQLASERFCVVENVLEKLHGRLRRTRFQLILSRQRVEEQMNKAETNINGMCHDVERQVLLIVSFASMIF